MTYEIIWSDFAKNELDKIYQYYSSEASEVIAYKIVVNLIKSSIVLSKIPRLGQIEPLLENKKIEYRYLIKGKHKIIYSIDEDNFLIKVTDIFDTRQNPKKLVRNI